MTKTINKETLDLNISFEGLSRIGEDGLVHPYHDMLGYPTIGIGHLLSKVANEDLSKYTSITQEEAYAIHEQDINKFSDGVCKLLTVDVTDNQFGAIVSLAYNIGLGNLKSSTLIKKLNENCLIDDVADEFLKWDRGGGLVVAGLTRRRIAERKLFLKS